MLRIRRPSDQESSEGRFDAYASKGHSGTVTDTVTAEVPHGGVTSGIVLALEGAWEAIRARHPEVPDVVVTFGAGSSGADRGFLTLGHFAAARWQRRGDMLSELFVGGEGLAAGAVEVLGTLLHEAAHGVALSRSIADTSRQGRYHNRRYRALASELELDVKAVGSIGWSGTSVPASTAAAYAAEVERLGDALVVWRHREAGARGGRGTGGGGRVVAECGCGRRVWVAPSVLELGAIACGVCGEEFRA
jgi:hypothetical protein